MKVNRSFGGTYRLHLQGRRVSQARNQHEDGSEMFLRTVGLLSPVCAAFYLTTFKLEPFITTAMEALSGNLRGRKANCIFEVSQQQKSKLPWKYRNRDMYIFIIKISAGIGLK
jgi:hypothetical protein